MVNKIAKSAIVLLCCVSVKTMAADLGTNEPIGQFYSDVPTHIAPNYAGGQMWFTLSSTPNIWVKSADKMNKAILTSLASKTDDVDLETFTTRNIENSTLQTLEGITVWRPSVTAADRVRTVVANSVSQGGLLSYGSTGTNASLLVQSHDQMKIATAALINKKPISYDTGTIYVFNTSTQTFDPITNALVWIQIEAL